MPRRTQREAVAERTQARLAEQHQRRSQAAQHGAETRRQRREAEAAEPEPQPPAETPTKGHVPRQSRPRAHPDLVTVALRGEFAARMRPLAERHGVSLARVLSDMLLVYEGGVEGGYRPGTSLANRPVRQSDREADA